ncbi:MAG: DUF4159 domain-containing protein [Elusimicrobia bacterium]|nr:DUF4159 domain-containing protein [Elusimicrobiota bacterium]
MPLVFLPWGIEWWLRRNLTRRIFSDVHFLQKTLEKGLAQHRLLERVLRILRAGLLLFLIFYLAGPRLRSSVGAQGEEGWDVLLAMDLSYSMSARWQGESLWSWAQKLAQGVLADLGPQDRAGVIFFSDRVEAGSRGVGRDFTQILRLIRSHAASYRQTDFRLALEEAYRQLGPASGRRRAILLFSDHAAHGFGESPVERKLSRSWLEGVPGYDSSIGHLGVLWPPIAQNAYIQNVVWQIPPRKGAAAELRMQAMLWGTSGRPAWPSQLWLFGNPRAQQGVSLRPGRAQTVLWRVEAGTGSFVHGALRLQKDELSMDDVYYFAVPLESSLKILCVDGDRKFSERLSETYFFRSAVASQGPLSSHRLEVLPPEEAAGADLAGYDVVLLANLERVDPAWASRLVQFVRGGGGLWVTLGDRVVPEGYAPLSEILPGFPLHPLGLPEPGEELQPAFWKDFEWQGSRVFQIYRTALRDQARVLMRLQGGMPVWLERDFGRGMVLLWTSSLDRDWTNWPLRPMYLPWVREGLQRLVPLQEEWRKEIFVGQSWVRGFREPVVSRVRVQPPSGPAESLAVDSDGRLRVGPFSHPGLYEISYRTPRGWKQEILAVNLDPSRESDLTPSQSVPWERLHFARFAQEWQGRLSGRPVRRPLAFAVVGLFGVETLLVILAGFRKRRLWGTGALGMAIVLGASASQGLRAEELIWTQLRQGESWDPYPEVHRDILAFLESTTSVDPEPERRIAGLDSAQDLQRAHFLVWAGHSASPPFSNEQALRLRNFLIAGGTLWIEDVSGQAVSSFDEIVRRELKKVFPEEGLRILPSDHPVYRSFYLLRSLGGRRMVAPYLEGISWEGRTCVLYSRNDILGAWKKDPLGNFLYPCVPGAEPQRLEAMKLTANLILYALTGTYKLDPVHQPFIERKLQR